MAEPQAFSLLFAVVLILVGLPMLLFGILQYSSQNFMGSSIIGIGIFMLVLGAFFILILLTQK